MTKQIPDKIQNALLRSGISKETVSLLAEIVEELGTVDWECGVPDFDANTGRVRIAVESPGDNGYMSFWFTANDDTVLFQKPNIPEGTIRVGTCTKEEMWRIITARKKRDLEA